MLGPKGHQCHEEDSWILFEVYGYIYTDIHMYFYMHIHTYIYMYTYIFMCIHICSASHLGQLSAARSSRRTAVFQEEAAAQKLASKKRRGLAGTWEFPEIRGLNMIYRVYDT